jgi:hypothetical protein
MKHHLTQRIFVNKSFSAHTASFYQNGLTWSQLEHAQFPNPLTDAQGTFHKPPTW